MKLAKTPLALIGPASTALAIGLAVACGDVYADPEGTVLPSTPVEIDAGLAPPALFCPDQRPRENSPCAAIGSTCEYGASADPGCNAVLTCRGSLGEGYWERVASGACHGRSCPEVGDVASLSGKPCTIEPPDGGTVTDADEAICGVSDGVCICTTGPGGSAQPRSWACARPIASCPTSRPLAGRPCASGLFCDYGSCETKRGPLMECESGLWVTGGQTCP